MESRFWKDLPLVRDKDGVRGTKIYSQAEGEIVHMYLEPGAKLPLHNTPVNVAFYILEGNPTIIIGDEEQSFKIAGIGQKAVKLEKYIKYDDIMEAVESGHEDGLEAIIKKIIEDYEPPAEEE